MNEREHAQAQPEEDLNQGTTLPSNLVEIQTPSESWRTEFRNEISSLRVNGEDVSKIHRAMEELRTMRDSSDRTLRRLVLLITLLVCSGLGIGVFALDYLLKFNADKIDYVIDLNLEAARKSQEGMIKIPLLALSLLEKHPNQLKWDRNRSTWTFLNTFTGNRDDFSDQYMYYSPLVLENLKNDFGLQWDGQNWNWTDELRPTD